MTEQAQFISTASSLDTHGEDRATRILDAAECLFAKSGFDGVTLRAIARQADVDVALANYHFGRKAALFEATFMRRAEVLNRWRLDALDKVTAEASPRPPTIRQIMDAYLYPLLHGAHLADPAWRNYYALVAQVNNSHEWGGKLMHRFFDPMVDRFIDALRAACPRATNAAIYWGYHCLSGALTLAFAQTGRIDELSDGECRSTDLEAAYTHMVDFVTAGFEAVCSRPAG